RCERVITVGALAVQDGHLFKPQELVRLVMLREPNLRSRRAPVPGRADQTNANPVLRWQIVAINLDEPVRIERPGVSDDVEVAVAVDVTETQAVIYRRGGLVFDAPPLVHIGEADAARAAQQPQEIATV